LDVAANAIKLRKHLAQIDPTAAFIFNPDALWHPAAELSIEHDGTTKNSNLLSATGLEGSRHNPQDAALLSSIHGVPTRSA